MTLSELDAKRLKIKNHDRLSRAIWRREAANRGLAEAKAQLADAEREYLLAHRHYDKAAREVTP